MSIKPGDKRILKVLPMGCGSIGAGIEGKKVEATVLAVFPYYILFDFGKYRSCASRVALSNRESIVI